MKKQVNTLCTLAVIMYLVALCYRIAPKHRSTLKEEFNGRPSTRMLEVFKEQAPRRQQSMKTTLEKKEGWFELIWTALVPEVYCPEMVKVGIAKKGGVWMCSPYEMPHGCRVLLLGDENMGTFKNALQEMANNRCAVTEQARSISAKENKWAGETKEKIQSYLERNDLFEVEVLRLTLGGMEHELIFPILEMLHPIPQILIQIYPTVNGQPMGYKFLELLVPLARMGYKLASYKFVSEPGQPCEYALIHESALARYRTTPLADVLAY